jgi:hypothetical protein
MLEKALGVGALRSWPYLVAKPSEVGDWGDEPACPPRRPTSCGCQSGEQSPWFRKVLPCLVSKPLFRGVAALWARMPPGLTTPCGEGLDSYRPYLGVRKPMRRFILLWWRRFEFSGVTHVGHACWRRGAPWPWTWKVWSLAFGNLPAKSMRCLGIRPAGWDSVVGAKARDPGIPWVLTDAARP